MVPKRRPCYLSHSRHYRVTNAGRNELFRRRAEKRAGIENAQPVVGSTPFLQSPMD
jgi:hypothetical protein